MANATVAQLITRQSVAADLAAARVEAAQSARWMAAINRAALNLEAFRHVLSGVGTRTEIRRARYGPLAGVRGAALLAGHELEAERTHDGRAAAAR